MRICDAFRCMAFLTAVGAAAPAAAFDPSEFTAETAPVEAFRYGFDAYRQGDKTTAVEALRFAAEKGHPIAQWKLGRMYAEGDGLQRDDLKAFEIFTEIANTHAEDNPRAPEAPFVANAFVALGGYYRAGIPNSRVEPNVGRARQMFAYAASYFGDPEAQHNLAWMYYQGEGGERDPRQAARWAKLSADKGHAGAQALLGHLLFEGDGVTRQPVLGLMFLSVARERAESAEQWIREMHEHAFSLATETERRTALALAEDWIEKNDPPR